MMGAEDTTMMEYLISSATCVASAAAEPVLMELMVWLLIKILRRMICKGNRSALRR